jgi:hypothetical protein
MQKPPHWYDVYPHGTQQGDNEQKIFICLARNPQKWAWRSLSALEKETGLSKDKIEKILYKYLNKGLVFQNPKNEEQWGYWSNVPEMLNKNLKSISNEDKEKRLKSKN